jgi:hypothetical protein
MQSYLHCFGMPFTANLRASRAKGLAPRSSRLGRPPGQEATGPIGPLDRPVGGRNAGYSGVKMLIKQGRFFCYEGRWGSRLFSLLPTSA